MPSIASHAPSADPERIDPAGGVAAFRPRVRQARFGTLNPPSWFNIEFGVFSASCMTSAWLLGRLADRVVLGLELLPAGAIAAVGISCLLVGNDWRMTISLSDALEQASARWWFASAVAAGFTMAACRVAEG